MSRAQRRHLHRQHAKSERSQAKRAAALACRARQRERGSRAPQTGPLGFVGDALLELAWAPLAWLIWPLSLIGRLMGIDTREIGPPRKRPEWMPAPDARTADAPDQDRPGARRSS